jgi:hypothetical protein
MVGQTISIVMRLSKVAAAISVVLLLTIISGSLIEAARIQAFAQLQPDHIYTPQNGVLNVGPPESVILSMPHSR